ncbi:rhodanese-like domain-containing protein [Pleomorphovibrio marinus]|uniref:rhodanese-like domain-containing protein n=1 Tax=Pleomorphovibrio marinus TaxID=2164132 RepID=UPI000E0A5290|nr:rhodanese-like domain-containing protein [Pleomorphovibrio marinus]
MWNWFRIKGKKYTDLSSLDFVRSSSHKGAVLMDVRTLGEYRSGHLKGAKHVDFFDATFRAHLDKLPRDKTYYVYCRSGNRSAKACKLMSEMGFDKVNNLSGGVMGLV